jgi:alkylhydroperoxidase family enzyme
VLGRETVEGVLADWRTAAIAPPLRATLAFLERLNRVPDDVQAADVAALRTAGVGRDAIRDAIYVCALFNVIDRVADALAFDVPSPDAFARSARVLLRLGYRLP